MFQPNAGVVMALAVVAPPGFSLQDPAQEPAQERAPVSELEKILRELQERYDEELEDLRFQVETLEKDAADARAAAAAPRAQSPNVFNPQTTVFGNFLGRWDDRHVFLEDDPLAERVDDRFNLREIELDMRAPIDPWADGVLIATLESEVPNEFETGVEEGYVVMKKLPLIDSAPGGLKVKVGRFRTDFGRFNKIHLHDLPQPFYPRSLQTFLGEEGMLQNGVSGQFFLPTAGEASSLEATLQVLDGGNVPLAASQEGSNMAALAHLAWFRELSDEKSLELGLSTLSEDSDRRLYGADATYKWKPYLGGEWRSFLVGGELFASDTDDAQLDSSSLGYYLWSQFQFDRRTYLGARYDRTQQLDDSDLVTDTLGAYLTYYTTEFLRFRLGLEHAESDLAAADDRDSLFLELNFVFGSHPVEPYWVNR